MDIFEQLKRDEGVLLKPYKDTVGKLTIGVGRNLDDVGITNDEALALLRNDVIRVSGSLHQEFPWTATMDDVRFGVLQNMGFNMGIGGLKGFPKFLSKLQAGDYEGAAAEMVDSAWYRQVGGRAQRLVKQIQTGEWQ